MRLLDESGRRLNTRRKSELSRVRGVEITETALLSTCDGERGVNRGGDSPSVKGPVPAAAAGRYPVEAAGFAKLQTSGVLVELRVQVPQDRVVMVTR